MEAYYEIELWDRFYTNSHCDEEMMTESEKTAWRDFKRVAEMDEEELLSEIRELEYMSEDDQYEEEVRALLQTVYSRYWDVYSVRLSHELSKLNVK